MEPGLQLRSLAPDTWQERFVDSTGVVTKILGWALTEVCWPWQRDSTTTRQPCVSSDAYGAPGTLSPHIERRKGSRSASALRGSFAAKGKIVFCSTAGPGWYADVRRDIIRNNED